MLIAACCKLCIFVRIELKSEHRIKTKVSEGDSPVLLPQKNLDRKGAVHSDRHQFLTVWCEGQM